MAKTNCASTAPASRQQLRSSKPLYYAECGTHDCYAGTMEQLVAAGLPAFEYPAGTSRRFFYDRDGRRVDSRGHPDLRFSVRRDSPRKFGVFVHYTIEEIEARKCKAVKRKDAQEALALVERESLRLGKMPQTGKEFAQTIADYVRWYINDQMGGLRQVDGEFSESGFRFGDDSMKEIDACAKKLYLAIRDASTTFDAKQRGRALAEARAKAASLDSPLQSFIATAVAAANDPGQRAAA